MIERMKLTRGNATPRSLKVALDSLGVKEGEDFEIGVTDGKSLIAVQESTGPLLCGNCKKHPGVWSQVIGWEKAREGGGTNHVALRESLGSLLCDDCMNKRKRGISPGQETLA